MWFLITNQEEDKIMKERKNYSAQAKVKIVREHLENKTPISSLAEKYEVHPTQIHVWKKNLFEGALDIFSGKHKKKRENGILSKLKQKLLKKDEVISILTEELIQLKKNINGEL